MLKTSSIAISLGLLLSVGAARAGTYAVTVSEGLTGGSGFDTANGNPFSGANTASATFNYTGALNFNNTTSQNNPGPGGDLNSAFGFSTTNIGNYSGHGTVVNGSQPIADYTSLSSFLGSSGSASGYTYGSYYTFDLGTLAGGTILSVLHDDGISVFQGGKQVGTSVSGPTSATSDVIDVTSSGDTILRYARENGTPSILDVAVPEPTSWAVLGLGLAGLWSLRRAKRA